MDPNTYSIESKKLKNGSLASFFIQFDRKLDELGVPQVPPQIAQNSGRSYKSTQNLANYPTISQTGGENCVTVNSSNNTHNQN